METPVSLGGGEGSDVDTGSTGCARVLVCVLLSNIAQLCSAYVRCFHVVGILLDLPELNY